MPCATLQVNYSSSCYYNTACLADPGRVAQWYNVKPWIWQCCSEGEWGRGSGSAAAREIADIPESGLPQRQSMVPTPPRLQWPTGRSPTLAHCAPARLISSTSASSALVRGGGAQAVRFTARADAPLRPLPASVEAFQVPMLNSTDAINTRYGGATPATTRVYASDGSDDPWQGATVRAPLGPDYPMSTAVCDGCSHCKDLGAPAIGDSAAIVAQRAAIRAAVVGWLGVPESTQTATPSPSPTPAAGSPASGRHLTPHAADALMGVGALLTLVALGQGGLAAWMALRGAPAADYAALSSVDARAAAVVRTGKGLKGPPVALKAWQWAALAAGAGVPGVVLLIVGGVA